MKLSKNSVTSKNGTVYYWIHHNKDSNAKTIVFTHGLTADHTMFNKQIEYFKENYTIVIWDVPMHGISRPYTKFSYENAAIELNTILEKEKLNQIILVGMSMGGYVVQAFLEKYPHRAIGFIGLGTTPFGKGYYSNVDMWCLKRVGTMFGWISDKALRNSIVKTSSSTYGNQVIKKILSSMTKEDLLTQLDIAYRVFTEENHDIEILCPTLLMVGEKDNLGRVKKYNQLWSKRKGYSLILIPESGHVCNCDNPDAVNREIEKFIKGLNIEK